MGDIINIGKSCIDLWCQGSNNIINFTQREHCINTSYTAGEQ